MRISFCLCRLQIEELSKPLRFSQQLDKAVTTNYKPVANHAYNVGQFDLCYKTGVLCMSYA